MGAFSAFIGSDPERTKKALPPAPPLGPMPNGSFRSTVDSWNRERDQRRIEKKLGLPEEGEQSC